MKTKVFALIMLIAVAACSGNKQAKLDALEKQRDEISQKIEKLEKEIAAEKDSASKKPTGTYVAVEDIKFQPFNHYIEVQGKLDGDHNIAVYPEAAGVIRNVYADAGQEVKAGQVLAQIIDDAFQEQLKSLQTNLDLATDVYKKQESLWNQHIGSEMQYLQAKTNKESLEAQLSGLKKQIDMTRIKSPINGTIEESLVKVGQAVSPAMPVYRVVNFSKLKVSADVAESYAAKINQGDEVIVYFPDIKEEIKARVTFCSKYINPTNRTFSVEAELKSNSKDLKANMVAIVKIKDYSLANAVVVPVNYIQSDNNGSYVLIAGKEKDQYIARKQPVKTGLIYNGLAEITGGLIPGQKIISSGYLSLNEGDAIRF